MSGPWEVHPVGGGAAAWPAAMAAALALPRPGMAVATCTPGSPGAAGTGFERQLLVYVEPAPSPARRRTGATSVARSFGVATAGRPSRLVPAARLGPAPPSLARRGRGLAASNLEPFLQHVESGWLQVGESPFPVDWCLRTWPGACDLVASVPVVGSTSLEARLSVLRAAWAGDDVELHMPAAGQERLAELMVPGDVEAPEDHPYVHRRLPRPPARRAAPSAGQPLLLRVWRGPRSGVQVVLDAECVVGRGAVDLDLDDPSAPTRGAIVVRTRGVQGGSSSSSGSAGLRRAANPPCSYAGVVEHSEGVGDDWKRWRRSRRSKPGRLLRAGAARRVVQRGRLRDRPPVLQRSRPGSLTRGGGGPPSPHGFRGGGRAHLGRGGRGTGRDHVW